MTDLFITGVLEGLVLSLIAFGAMIPLRLLNFADLTSEGTYPLGAALSAYFLMQGTNPLLTLILASIGSGLCGLGTAYIHLRFHLNSLLSGIILSTMLYSINLRLMASPNVALFQYSFIPDSINIRILLLICAIFSLTYPLFLFMKTQTGLRLRAVGLNPEFSQRQGINTAYYIFLGMFLGNLFCGFAGAFMAQLQGYADIGMGIGIILQALAALMIGESILGTFTLKRQFLAPIVGSLIYQQIQGLALFIGLVPSDLKLLTGCMVLAVVGLRRDTHLP